MFDQRGGATAHERALDASEARMAKRSGRAVNEGLDGRSERQRVGRGTPERRQGEAAGKRPARPVATAPGCHSSNAFHPRAAAGSMLSAAAARSNKFSDKSLDRRDPLAGGRLLELPDDG